MLLGGLVPSWRTSPEAHSSYSSYCPQIIQGVDILAKKTNAFVIVPDFFEGDTPEHSWFFEQTDENVKKRTEWFTRIGNFALHVEPFWKLSDDLRAGQDGKQFTKIGCVGYCCESMNLI